MSFPKAPVSCRSGPRNHSDLAIATALALRRLLYLPLPQTESFLISICELAGIPLDVRYHSTLPRRGSRPRLLCLDIPPFFDGPPVG